MKIINGQSEEKNDARLNDETGQDSDKFGKVVGALHNKSKLASLRTYQGDMAQFIKDKNESVITVAVKEKERKEKPPVPHIAVESFAGDKEEKISKAPSESDKKSFQTNITLGILSVLLVVGGIVAAFYILKFMKKEPASAVAVKTEIIPYNNLLSVSGATKDNVSQKLSKLSLINGINIVEISDGKDLPVQKAQDFFDLLGVSMPDILRRALQDRYAFGIISQRNENSVFLVITVDDFGRAFSAMLDWEGSMTKDLYFVNSGVDMATSTDIFAWKDIILKNKDTRGLVDQDGRSKIAYTFLDKNTILITGDISAIGDISSAYAARSVAR